MGRLERHLDAGVISRLGRVREHPPIRKQKPVRKKETYRAARA